MDAISLPVVITLTSIAWSAGVAVGLFASKFVSKKECKSTRDQIWSRVDKIQDAMTGKPIRFELRMVEK